jgi:hypothetical protein
LKTQIDLFDIPKDSESSIDKKYTAKIKAPIYTPKHDKPHPYELFDSSKSDRLIESINKSSASKEEKAFLIEAAKRHIVFNYSKIADFYAHSSKEVQELMEESALVIIDFDRAIECGYVKLSEEIADQYLEDTANEG